VGSKPAGKSKYGQLDLSGSMSEWTLDYYYDDKSMTVGCDDKCAELKDAGVGRDVRGGDFAHDGSEVQSIYHVGQPPDQRQTFIGFRCARAPSGG
jgi:formylglycine-generating enzyme required for sulfatase activity